MGPVPKKLNIWDRSHLGGTGTPRTHSGVPELRAVGKMISYLGDEIWCTALPFVSLIIHEKSQ